jgi:hypothetical protein
MSIQLLLEHPEDEITTGLTLLFKATRTLKAGYEVLYSYSRSSLFPENDGPAL